MLQRFLVFFYLFLVVQGSFAQFESERKTIDSLIFISKSDDVSIERSLELAILSKDIASKIDVDSITLKVNRNYANALYYNDQMEEYMPQNYENLILASKLRDSVAMAVASANLAYIYRMEQQNDSAFYLFSNAVKYLSNAPPSYLKASSYYMLADVQQVAKVYDAAERDVVNAIAILNLIEQNDLTLDTLWGAYNLLAIIAKELGNYDQAIEYYEKALSYSGQISDGVINEVYTLNNISSSYREKGEFQKSIDILIDLESRKSEFDEFDPSFIGTIKNNIALAKLDRGGYEFTEVETELKEARSIAYQFDDDNGKVVTTLDLSRLYLENDLTDSVLKYANEALKLSDEFSSNEAKQRALYLLSEVTPGEQGKAYLKEHIRLGDSLDAEERSVRNKIARIKFDTDQIQARNEKISRENLYLVILSVALLFTGLLVYVILSQRARNRELRLKQTQQEANEEIYNLMLKQQDKIEEARAGEKIRVSKELHDGVLGRLFGVRLSLDSLNFSEGKEAALNRGKYMGQLKEIEEDIRKISHEMNTDFVAGSGFVDILRELVDNQAQAYSLKAQFEAAEAINWDRVPNKVKINLYRIVQESMQNVYKHAKATHINVAISLINDDICLEVADDGQGFDMGKQRKGIGLKNMSSRVAEVNGTIEFQSKIGQGTTLKMVVPGDQL